MAGHGEAAIRKYVRTCLLVFSILMVLTIVTVAISYLHLPTPAAIGVALLVATVKASLVALFFMHLISERQAVYYLLGLTATFFVVLMYLPSGWYRDEVKLAPLWDALPAATEPAAQHHDGGAGEADTQH